MDSQRFTHPIDLRSVSLSDPFWQRETELVRRRVIPYQWEALNDRVPDAAPSWCMRNFRTAGRMMAQQRTNAQYVPPKYTFRGFEALPDDPAHPEDDRFYGFVFQDTDFSKWIEAVGYSLAQHPDEQLEKTADAAIDIVCAAQTPDGYLDTYYIINGMDGALTNLRDHHELYCLGHLIEGAISYFQATGKDQLLHAACRFADYIADRFGVEDGKCKGYPGHEIAEMALFRLYELTREEKYLRLALYFINQRGQEPNYFREEEQRLAQRDHRAVRSFNPDYYQAGKPVREQEEATGHAVRAVYLYSGMADAARLTCDETLKTACERLWRDIVQKKLYITGGIGSTHLGEAFSYAYDLPNDAAYSETCAAIGLAFFARRMLQMTPKQEYGDVMELALYNTVLAGMSLDGTRFFYVNPLSVVPEACEKDERLRHVKPVRQRWFGCACCPPNIARIVSSIASYAYTENDTALLTHLYLGGTVEKRFGQHVLRMTTETNYPWDGHIKVTLHAERPVSGTLAFRLPGWCRKPSLQSEKQIRIENGYAYLTGEWRDGEEITLDFPMTVRLFRANSRVREDTRLAAVMRGPVTYCAEEADNGADLHLLRINADQFAEHVSVLPDHCFGHPSIRLLVPGYRAETDSPDSLYAEYCKPVETPCKIALIPYYAWGNRGEGEMRVWLNV